MAAVTAGLCHCARMALLRGEEVNRARWAIVVKGEIEKETKMDVGAIGEERETGVK